MFPAFWCLRTYDSKTKRVFRAPFEGKVLAAALALPVIELVFGYRCHHRSFGHERRRAIKSACGAKIRKIGLNRKNKGTDRCHCHSKSFVYSPCTWACCQIYQTGVYWGRLLPLKESRDAHNKCNSRTQKLNNSNDRDERGLVRKQTVWRRKKV